MKRDWDERYVTGDTPWDSGVPEPLIVEAVSRSVLPEGRLLEIGCGTGTNSFYLAEQGYQVTALDVASTAIERAKKKNSSPRITYHVFDILTEEFPPGPYDAVIDRGCFHLFGDPQDRELIVTKIASVLRTGGRWWSLMGSTEGPPRESGPPRRRARDVVNAIEPHLEIITLESTNFTGAPEGARAWIGVFAKREMEAQPPTPVDN